MLRITTIDAGNQAVTLRLEGRLAGLWVTETRAACAKLLTEGRSIKLDLAEVDFADQDGVDLLVDFSSQGVLMKDCSPFVTEQLKAANKA